MIHDRDAVGMSLDKALSGKDAHVEVDGLLDGLNWKLAGVRPHGVPHSVFQLVNHMTYWQEWVARWLDGKRPRPPKHAAGGWPGRAAPADRRQWLQSVRRFRTARAGLERRARQVDLLAWRGKMANLEAIHLVASHTSYHAGQVALLRQVLAAWPPPSGGVTW